MPVCKTCNSTVPENCRYCGYCGAEILPETDPEEERRCLHHLRRNLRHERVAWKSFGIFYLVYEIIFALYLMAILIPALVSEGDALFAVLFIAVYFSVFASIFVALTIVNFVMSAKARNYSEQVPTDCEAAAQRAGRVGTIVLGALFNQIALAFIIVNFIHVKTHKDLLDRIIEKQKNS